MNPKTVHIANLSIKIFNSSVSLTTSIKRELEPLWSTQNITQPDKDTRWCNMLFEFLFCYLYITDRKVLFELGHQKRQEFMNFLVSILQHTTVESVFNSWDENRKSNFRELFSDLYSESQKRYIKGKELLNAENPATGNGIFSILGREIADINNSSLNPEILCRTVELITHEYVQLALEEHVMNYKSLC